MTSNHNDLGMILPPFHHFISSPKRILLLFVKGGKNYFLK
jgi:hypothetical protein